MSSFKLESFAGACRVAFVLTVLSGCDVSTGDLQESESERQTAVDQNAGIVLIVSRHSQRVNETATPCLSMSQPDLLPLPTLAAATAGNTSLEQSLALPILWEPTKDPDDGMELSITVSAVEAAVDARSESVTCWLEDTGRFVVPASVRSELGRRSFTTVTLVHRQNSDYAEGQASLSIMQLTYP